MKNLKIFLIRNNPFVKFLKFLRDLKRVDLSKPNHDIYD